MKILKAGSGLAFLWLFKVYFHLFCILEKTLKKRIDKNQFAHRSMGGGRVFTILLQDFTNIRSMILPNFEQKIVKFGLEKRLTQ